MMHVGSMCEHKIHPLFFDANLEDQTANFFDEIIFRHLVGINGDRKLERCDLSGCNSSKPKR